MSRSPQQENCKGPTGRVQPALRMCAREDCGAAFDSGPRHKRYCSDQCQRIVAKRRPVLLDCEECGEGYYGCRTGKDAEHRFNYCSRDCEATAKSKRYSEEPTRVSACAHGTNSIATCPACTFMARAEDTKLSLRSAVRRDPCSYCGGGGGSVDHIDPQIEGGLDGWSNWTGACRRCNSTKGKMPALLAMLWVPANLQYHRLRRLLYQNRGEPFERCVSETAGVGKKNNGRVWN